MSNRWVFFISASMTLIAACSSVANAAELRLLVKLHQASADGDAIAVQASAISGTSVRYKAAVSGGWHALELTCPDTATCDSAVARLRADHATYDVVQLDERKSILPH